MPIVGEAVVLVRVISNKLADDIRRAVKDGLNDSNADIDHAGQQAGDRLSDAVRRGWRNSSSNLDNDIKRTFARFAADSNGVIDDSGSRIGQRFTRSIGSGIRSAAPDLGDDLRRAITMRPGDIDAPSENIGERIGNGTRRGFRASFAKARNEIQDEFSKTFGKLGADVGESTGNDIGNGVNRGLRRSTSRNRGRNRRLFQDFGKEFGDAFNLGIGAARMGQAAISGLILAGPSLLSGFGAILTALAGEIVNFAAAIGPGLAGAVGVGIAGVSTLALNAGLLYLALSKAFKTVEGGKIKDAFKEIGNILGTPVAHGLLEGMLDSVNRLKAALPGLTPLLERTGQAYGQIIERILDTVASAENMTRIGKILETNIGFLQNFKDGIGGLVNSFLILFAASKPFVDFIGEGIKRFGEWASASLTVSEANGNLAAWMDGMLQNFKDLWALVKDFGAGIANVFAAAGPAGKQLFDSLAGIGDKFRAWTDNPANQERMITFFENARVISQQIFDLLGKIFTAGGNAFTNMDTDKLTHFFDTLTGVGQSIASIFSQIKEGAGGNLAKIFDDIGLILERAASSGAIASFAAAISALALALADLLVQLTANPIGAKIAGIAVAFLLFGGIIKTLLSPIFLLGRLLLGLAFPEGLLAALGALSAPVLAVVAAVTALVGIFVLAYTQSQSLRDAIAHLGALVGGAFMAVWDKLSPKLEVLWGKIERLASAIGDRLAPVIEFLAPIVARVVEFIGDLLGNIIDAIGGFIDIITGILTGNWQLIWQGVTEVLSAAWQQILTILGGVLSLFSIIWDTITAVVYNAGQVIWGILTSVWTGIASLAYTVWNAIYAFFEMIFNAITSTITNFGNAIPPFLAGVWQWIQDTAISVWNAIYAFFESIFNTITGAITSFGNAIPPFLAGIWQWVQDTAISVWNAIYGFFEGIFNTITGAIRSFGNAIPPFLAGVWETIKSVATSVWNAIYGFLSGIFETITGAIRTFGNAIPVFLSSVWNGLVGIVSGIWNGIKEAITGPINAALGVVQTVVGTITGAIQGALDFISRLTAAITSIPDVPNPTGSGVAGGAAFGGTSLLGPQGIGGGVQRMLMRHLFEIPGLATGGIVNPRPGGSMFRLGEGGQRERVEPLSVDGLSARDRALIKTIVASTVATMSGGGVNVDVRIGEHGLDQFVTQTVRREQSDLARRVGKVKR